MYLENSVKASLGLIGHTNPSLELVQERVKATGYTGYVAADFLMPSALVKKARAKKTKPAADD